MNDFNDWCKRSFLNINVSKTKELIIDFRKQSPSLPLTIINGQPIEIVKEYKYLGTIIDSKLCFESHTDAVCAKAQQRMYFYRRLRNFNIDHTLMRMFYFCFIESVLTFCFICWFGSLSTKNKKRLESIVRTCSKIAGTNFSPLSLSYSKRVAKKAQSIAADSSHPLCCQFKLLPSGRRYSMPRCRSNRFKNSFIPTSVSILNTLSELF